MNRLAIALLALGVGAAAAACGKDDDSGDRSLLELRPVVATNPGTLVSAPVVRFTSFAGRVEVTGLSKEKTDDLFRRLDKLIKRD